MQSDYANCTIKKNLSIIMICKCNIKWVNIHVDICSSTAVVLQLWIHDKQGIYDLELFIRESVN